MFSRVTWENWQILFPIIAFTLIFLGYLFFALRGLLMRKKKADKMSRLPLEDEEAVTPGKSKADENKKSPPHPKA